MLHIALRGVRHNVGRYLATLVAIMTGVAFFAAAGAVSARVVSALEGDVDARYAGVDAAVVPEADASAAAEPLVLDEATFDAFGQVDGVAAVAGEVTGPVAFQRGSSRPFGDGATGRLWITDDQLNPITISEGSAPAADDEVAIDAGTAERHDLGVGDEVTLLSVGGEIPVRVSAITAFGNSDALDNGGTVSLAPGLAFVALTGGRVEYQDAFLRVTGDPDAVVAELRDAVPSGFDVQSGDQFRADKRQEAGSFGRFLKTGLQAFALLALLVGGFVIYNTFSVTIAQRQRELAVLSAIGATPKQLKRSLRAEGLIIGLLGSTLGAAMGLGLAFLLVFVLGVAGMDLPGSGVGVEPGSLVQAVLLGTVITLGSVVIPVRRAAKIEPIEALRVADVQGRAISTSRKVVAIGLLAVGAAGLFVGSSPAAIGIGALLLVVGAIVAGPLVALGGARLLRPVMGRFGLEGRLALDNTVRSPKRTATTANALLIGVFLVTFVTVAGTSLKDFAVREIQQLESADFVVASSGGSLDDALLADLAGAKGVRAVTPFRREAAIVDGEPAMLSTAGDGDLVSVASIEAEQGSLDDLAPGTIALGAISAGTHEVGDRLTVSGGSGASEELEVVAILSANLDAAQVGDLVAVETFDALVGDTAPTVALIDAVDGAETDTQDALEDVVASRPDISVSAGNEIGRLVGSIFDFVIGAINGLLAMSVVVALIGIVNTLSLSIIERRRELGLLRIVGMVDRRVQRMVRLESVVISLLGTVTGVVLGIALGAGLVLAIDRTSDAGIDPSLPVVAIATVVVLGVVLGFLASIVPARRSTRIDVLDAVAAS